MNLSGCLLLSVALAGLACARPPQSSRLAVVARWAEEDATELYVPPAEGSTAQVREPPGQLWKFEGKNEWRSGALALPAAPISWSVQLPGRARLVTACFAPAAGLVFHIELASAGARPVELVRSSSAECREAEGEWKELTVDLSAWSGQTVEIGLRVDSGDPRAWGAWGEPLLLAPEAAKLPDVLLVSLDTTRADRMELYGGPSDTAPFLTRWARREAVVFDQAVSSAPWTFPSHVSLFSGLEAYRHGCLDNNDRSQVPRLETFATILRRHGYRVLAVTGGGLLQPSLGFHHGFERYAFWDRRERPNEELEVGIGRAIGWLERYRGQRIALFFHTYEAHVPNPARDPAARRFAGLPTDLVIEGRFDPASPESGFFGLPVFILRAPTEAATRLAVESDHALLTAYYDSALAFIDRGLERLLGAFETPARQGSLVVVTADHGEALGEHGRMAHGQMFESNLHVPLMIRFPDATGAGRRVPDLVSTVDILPSILASLGIPEPDDIDGRSLAPLARGEKLPSRPAWSYSAAQNRGLAMRLPDGTKAVFSDSAWAGDHFWGGLFDLTTDPEELTDRAAAEPERWTRLQRQAYSQAFRQQPRLRLVAVNLGDRPADVELRSDVLKAYVVKSLLAPATLTWRGAGVGGFSLPPGEQRELNLIGSRWGAIQFEIRAHGECGAAPPLHLTLDRSSSAARGNDRLDLPPCSTAVSEAKGGAVEIRSEWLWPAERALSNQSSGPDKFEEEQLRALGYL